MDVNTKMDEVFGDQVKNDQGWKNEIGNFMLTFPSAVINTQTVSYAYTCVAPACDPGREIYYDS